MKRILLFVGVSFLLVFQNCSKVDFAPTPSMNSLSVCNGVSCDLTPLTDKPAVTTVLLAIGDQANDQLVINGASSQLIAESIIRYSSPKMNPKILLVEDSNTAGEDPEDTLYVKSLLSRYNVTHIKEPSGGLRASDLVGFDLVWFNNPGHEMGHVETRDALLAFKGAVVLQGDDLTRGSGFSLETLTGLKAVDNGTSVSCNSLTYNIDNNLDQQYLVTLNSEKIPGIDSSTIQFKYGNDIDLSEVVRADLEVLAYARGLPSDCTEQRPAIVRWTK